MPNFKTLHLSNQTSVYFWKVSESFDQLRLGLILNHNTLIKLNLLKNDLQKRCLLAIRKLLNIAGYSDDDLFYNSLGKPFLTDGKFISISHSFDYCAIIISKEPVGIDIERKREKIKKIQTKFTDVCFQGILSVDQEITILTKIWAAKESLYKIYGKKGVNFRTDINVVAFDIGDSSTKAYLTHNNKVFKYNVNFLLLNDFICSYVFMETNNLVML